MTTHTLPAAAYEKLTTAIARDTGERRSAALWIHAADLVRHAQDHGLLQGTGPAPEVPRGRRAAQVPEDLASSHPAL